MATDYNQELLKQSLIALDEARDLLKQKTVTESQLKEAFRHMLLATAKLNMLISSVKGQFTETKSNT